MAEHEANELRQLMEQDLRELTLLLAGIGDAAACQRPPQGGLSVRELLAFFSERIRQRFHDLREVLRDPAYLIAATGAGTADSVQAIVASCGTMSALVARCRSDFEDLAYLVAVAPSERLTATARVMVDGNQTGIVLLVWLRWLYVEEFASALDDIRAVRGSVRG